MHVRAARQLERVDLETHHRQRLPGQTIHSLVFGYTGRGTSMLYPLSKLLRMPHGRKLLLPPTGPS